MIHHLLQLRKIRKSTALLYLIFSVFISRLPAQDTGGSVFGQKDNTVAGLIGIMYDLKQNQKRQPTGVDPVQYPSIIEEFLKKNWDESVLNRYFRAARPLYTTQIFIPLMSADDAPKAFDVDKVMKPSVWVVHYKGQVSPPEDGNYRFIAYADDVIAVGINGKTVCVGPHRASPLRVWTSPEKKKAGKAGNGELTYGEWITLKKDEPIDLDVMVGERPGGQFCAFLLYEKQGTDYPREGEVIRYPIFQLAPFDTPVRPISQAALFSVADKVWKAHQ